ncbi:hypothetical protein M422DRAFT_247334 [Sphaerobolus stellatus SS14]|nr:hypothetical protein M422DRAFT_247334 [Sphaerobolus stellatus SS14]
MAELDPFEPDEDSDDEDNNRGGFAPQEDDDEIAPQPIECRISIAKPRGGALLIDGYAWSNKLSILKISYIKDARLVTKTPKTLPCLTT